MSNARKMFARSEIPFVSFGDHISDNAPQLSQRYKTSGKMRPLLFFSQPVPAKSKLLMMIIKRHTLIPKNPKLAIAA
ncbi:MAG: hypothetical protein ABSC11_08285 [Smithella sp.]